MERKDVIQMVDDGANFYCRLLGQAGHMEFADNGCYSMIYPKPGEQGGTSLFNVRLEHLSDEEAQKRIDEIKARNVHTWWGLTLSDRLADLVFGPDRPAPPTSEEEMEEAYMALFPTEKPAYPAPQPPIEVRPVQTPEEFRVWADICNSMLHGNFPIMHRDHHYPLCEQGIMPCYIATYDGAPAAVAAIMHNGADASLEFVATLEPYRRRGLATAVCQTAADHAFTRGARVVTLRSFQDAIKLYKSLGFNIY